MQHEFPSPHKLSLVGFVSIEARSCRPAEKGDWSIGGLYPSHKAPPLFSPPGGGLEGSLCHPLITIRRFFARTLLICLVYCFELGPVR
jgi:hypothetical protein